MTKSPEQWADEGDPYDCTGHLGPLFEHKILHDDDPWLMYSYDRPAYKLWNAIAAELYANGWRDAQIKDWLQSKGPRWALDGSLGDSLDELGKTYAKEILGGDK